MTAEEAAPSVLAMPSQPGAIISYVFSWTVIAALVALHAVISFTGVRHERTEASKVDLMHVNLLARVTVGARSVSDGSQIPVRPPPFRPDDFPETHWGHAVILNEVQGPKAASRYLDDTDGSLARFNIQLTADQRRLRDTLRRIFADQERGDFEASSVSPGERAFLRDRMGFVGSLTVHPPESNDTRARQDLEQGAVRFLLVTSGVALAAAFVFLSGIAGLILAGLALVAGKFRPRFASAKPGRAHVYGETFAIWFAFFTILQALAGRLVPEPWHLTAAGFSFFVSLLALSWPLLRGVTWLDVRTDIGLRSSSHPLVEAGWGLCAYVAMTPIIVAAVFLLVTVSEFAFATDWTFAQLNGKNAPAHPIVFELERGNVAAIVTVLILACLAAPLIEETMFRGVLYRHLRDSSRWAGRGLSVLFSGGLNSLIFAAIHPQGLLAIPILGTLAFGFSLVREWRGSLIAPMVMHALNNGIMVTLLLLLFGSL